MRPKYLILDRFAGVNNYPVIFSACEEHYKVARNHGGPENVLGAGFVQIFVNEENEVDVSCFGESVTLEKVTRGKVDADVIRRMLLEEY